MSKRDYYEILGVQRGAPIEVLKQAYRKLAKECHPDRNSGDPDAERRFKEVNEAYDVLKDDQKRAAYDRFGHAAFENGMGRGQAGFDFSGSFADVFDDLFGEFMGRRPQGGRSRGADLRYDLEITLEDAYRGRQATIDVPTSITCEPCHGTGAASGSSPVACQTCNGQGRVRAAQGFFTIERTCPACQGQGRVIRDPCAVCSGAGRIRRTRTLSVSIPAGVEDGTRIRLAREGEAGMRGAPPGDLYIFLSLKPHTLFEREGADLHCRVPISFPRAALGGEIEVPTLEGVNTKVAIPAGTQTGRRFRLRGKGMPVLHSSQHGELYVTAFVETPVNLTKRQKELLAEFASLCPPEDHQPESAGFFAKVKDFFSELSGD